MDLMDNNTEYVDGLLELADDNIHAIIAKLKELNPDATIIMQTVYNPIYEDSDLISSATRVKLDARNIPESEYREIGKLLIGRMNEVIRNYKKNNPDDIELVDVYKAFDDISNADASRGVKLVYSDWIHPSNEGHAVIADAVQAKLEELGFADSKRALKNYKILRSEQLEDLFCESVDVKAVKRQISKAKSVSEVTNIYFRAIDGKMPVYC